MRELSAADEQTWHNYYRDLDAEHKSPHTIAAYRYTFELLSGTLEYPGGVLDASRADIVAWLGAGAKIWARATLDHHYRRTRTFFGWAVRVELREDNPMATVRPPQVIQKLPDIPAEEDVRALIGVCQAGKGKTRSEIFRNRRDLAILRILLEAGAPRANEMAALMLDDVDLRRRDEITIRGKGGLDRVIPLGAKSARALSVYLRARVSHPDTGLPNVFLGLNGPMTRWGIGHILSYRSQEAGVKPRLYPHQFRHLAAHRWFMQGGGEGDAMKLFGWRSTRMPHLYGGSAAAQRAREHARLKSIGDAF